jgi:hypothetical protein
LPRLRQPRRNASAVVQPSRLDAATKVAKGILPMSDEVALHAVELRRVGDFRFALPAKIPAIRT